MRTGLGRFLDHTGRIIELGTQSFSSAFHRGVDLGALFAQIEKIGIGSIPVTTLTAAFSSMVMAVQFAVQMDRFGAKEWVGSVVSLSLVRELGPVLTALMVGGRVGAGIAAELGSMKVTEQVDALRSMGGDPIRELVVPRVVACIIALPLLTAFADVLGVTGAGLVVRLSYQINATYFFHAMLRSVSVADVTGGLLKTLFFGLEIGLIACYQGLAASGGTEEVGRATTRAVVISSIVTLVSDFVLTNVLLTFGL
jgi:phospholipid/cholesterol/gamma-HCH transport system permease protein